MTIKQILTQTISMLRKHNSPSSRLDAEILLAYVLNKPREYLFSHDERKLTVDEMNRYRRLIERRANSEPIAYIIGQKEFYGLDFFVSKDVLIPRPETEHLVEYIINVMQDDGIILDICTGSGCVPIAVKYYSSHKLITHLSDVSLSALNIARKNYHRVFNTCPVSFVSDMFKSIPIENHYDLISANPPYIKSSMIDELDRNVRAYEPIIALDGGVDGLRYYKDILNNAYHFLRVGGRLVLEIDDYVYNNIISYLMSMHLFTKYNKDSLEVIKDYAGRHRVLSLEKRL